MFILLLIYLTIIFAFGYIIDAANIENKGVAYLALGFMIVLPLILTITGVLPTL